MTRDYRYLIIPSMSCTAKLMAPGALSPYGNQEKIKTQKKRLIQESEYEQSVNMIVCMMYCTLTDHLLLISHKSRGFSAILSKSRLTSESIRADKGIKSRGAHVVFGKRRWVTWAYAGENI